MPYKIPPKSAQFKKGQSGNPKGRPKQIPEIDDLLADILGEQDGKSEAKDILLAIVKKAKKGDVRAAELILDRTFGKVKERIEHTGEIVKGFKILPASGKGTTGK